MQRHSSSIDFAKDAYRGRIAAAFRLVSWLARARACSHGILARLLASRTYLNKRSAALNHALGRLASQILRTRGGLRAERANKLTRVHAEEGIAINRESTLIDADHSSVETRKSLIR